LTKGICTNPASPREGHICYVVHKCKCADRMRNTNAGRATCSWRDAERYIMERTHKGVPIPILEV
jgi:hypothetical protein